MIRKIYHPSGKGIAEAPGTLRFTGKRKTDHMTISVMDYDEVRLNEHKPDQVEECFKFRDTPAITWININGLNDVDALGRLGERFGLHPLVMEDILNVRQRPKLEDHDGYFFIVCRMVDFDEETQQIRTEQVSFILTKNVVISLQERPGDVFEPVRDRIRVGRGRIRKAGPDYLAYALLDAVADHYFVVLEKFSDAIENLEVELLEDPSNELLETIHGLKREMILLRRSAWPLREVLNNFMRSDSDLVAQETGVFLRDVLDHTVQVVEVIESFRDILSGLQDLYLSSISNRMNEVMKVLTIVSTVFVPLTFVAGIYGMNFQHMPELGWKWSYPLFWVGIAAMGGGMWAFFRRRGWI